MSGIDRTGRRGWLRVTWLVAGLAFAMGVRTGVTHGADDGATGSEVRKYRQPIAVAMDEAEQQLLVANRKAGSVSVFDWATRQLVGEFPVGQLLSDLVRIDDSRFLVTDEAGHALTLFDAAGGQVREVARITVPTAPVGVVVGPDGKSCWVASLWARQLTRVELTGDGLRLDRVIDLPFAPRKQLVLPHEKRLIVADSFGGRLGVVDLEETRLLHVRSFPAHNIRGLGVSADGKMLVIAHQMLNELAHSVQNDVHWGLLISNDLRWLKLSAVLSAEDDLYTDAHMHPLGHAGSATGDPAGLVVTGDGTVVVSLGGVGEIAMGREHDFSMTRHSVGKRPTGMVTTHDGRWLVVANTFADSLSVYDLKERQAQDPLALGPAPKLTLEERGEQVFYDARVSHDAWMSCHSCHTDGHTNGLTNDNFSDASFGAPKRVLSLLGNVDTAPFAWDASAKSLEQQIRNSIEKTMQSDRAPRDEDVRAIAAFLGTLKTPPSIDAARGLADDGSAERGQAVFATLGCVRCHTPPIYTSAQTYNVDLVDELGRKEFNPPSLRGVSQRAPYFHDNRAATLEAVFREFGHQMPPQATDEQLRDLLAFLRRL
jgi:DNA-binding beta-propeller fold protein YncE